MRLERTLLVGIAGIVVGLVGVASAQTKAVVWPAGAIKWTDTAAAPGAKMAALWGDPAKGAYGALKQVPAGTALAAHTHKNDSHVVMIKGTISLDIDGKKHALGPGSYTMIPGGVPHSATCGTGAACEYFEHMTGAFDSSPAKH
jgi:mannose-6-phosphate isomerase-like protein (cupin superfamily)